MYGAAFFEAFPTLGWLWPKSPELRELVESQEGKFTRRQLATALGNHFGGLEPKFCGFVDPDEVITLPRTQRR